MPKPTQTLSSSEDVLKLFDLFCDFKARTLRATSRDLDAINSHTPDASLHRMLATLVKHQWLKRDPETQQYYVGEKLPTIAFAYTRYLNNRLQSIQDEAAKVSASLSASVLAVPGVLEVLPAPDAPPDIIYSSPLSADPCQLSTVNPNPCSKEQTQ